MPNISSILIGFCIALLAIILGLAIWIWLDSGKISELKTDNSMLTAANAEFKTDVDKQNSSIAKLKADGQALQDAAAKAQKEAAQKDAALSGAVVALQKIKPSTDACSAANGLFNQYIGGK